jgi:hypothetical protein
MQRATTILTALVLILGAAAIDGCSKKDKSGACVDVGGAACQECRDNATAPFCDAHYVTPVASGNIKVNGRKGCCGFEDPALRASCENILLCIRKENCADGDSPVKCLCGPMDMPACAAVAKWPGACTSVYQAAMAGGPPGELIRLFGDPRSPIGIANAVYQCDVDSKCPCGDKK